MRNLFARILLVLLLCAAFVFVYADEKDKENQPHRTTDIDMANPDYIWDVYDQTEDDNGGIDDGGGDDAFDDWGMIQVRISDAKANILTATTELDGFTLTWDNGRRFNTTVPVVNSNVSVRRAIYAPDNTDYLRYIDTFTNTGTSVRKVAVAWGGDLGSDSSTTVAASSSGDRTIDAADTWAVTTEDYPNPTDPPVGYVLSCEGNTVRTGTGDYDEDPIVDPWPGDGNDNLSFVYQFTLQPGQTFSLAYFIYLGTMDDAGVEDAKTWAAAMIAAPDFDDLSAAEKERIINWNNNIDPNPEPEPEPDTFDDPFNCGCTGLELVIGMLALALLRFFSKVR